MDELLNRFKLIVSIFTILISSCIKSNNEEINTKIVKEYFFLNNNLNFLDSNIIVLIKSSDTVVLNLNNSFEKSLLFLKSKFFSIDLIKANLETRNYIKALLLAEFVYASFSIQILSYDKCSHSDSVYNWNKMSLKEQFDFGNNNTQPIWCGDRTSFYIKLLDSLLCLKSSSLSIKNIHTFPLVHLKTGDYIIDPFDPFVVLNEKQDSIINYRGISNNKYFINYIALRTNRIFGNKNEIISRKFVIKLMNEVNIGKSFCDKLNFYLENNDSFNKNYLKWSLEPFNKNGTVYSIVNGNYSFIIKYHDNKNNAIMNINHFKKFYFGIDCK